MGRLQLTRKFDQEGDTIVGDKIAIEAMSITVDRVDHRTSKHRGQFADARYNAMAVIEMPFRYVLEKKSGKSKRSKSK